MIGTLVNAASIIVGGLIGILIGKHIKEDYKTIIMQGVSLSVIIIGISMAIKTENVLLLIISIVLGSIMGQVINIDKNLETFGKKMQSKISNNNTFAKGFVIATLVFCVGSMSVVGAIEDGLNANHDILYAKAVLDGLFSIVFASTLGFGVIFSFIPVLIYQGLISLIAQFGQTFLCDNIVNEMSAVGGVLIMAIGIVTLKVKEIKIANMLPSIFIPIAYGIFINIL